MPADIPLPCLPSMLCLAECNQLEITTSSSLVCERTASQSASAQQSLLPVLPDVSAATFLCTTRVPFGCDMRATHGV